MAEIFRTSVVVPELCNISSGIGLRAPHHQDIIETLPAIGWLEVHSENFFHFDAPHFQELMVLREHYPVTLHGVGLSLGSAEGLDDSHIDKLKQLAERIDPAVISEHVSWSRVGGVSVPDLLPVPLTSEALDVLSRNIDHLQNRLGRSVLVENPSSYLSFKKNDMDEAAFLTALCNRTGCGLLLDVNNIHVSAHNTDFDAQEYLQNIPPAFIGEIHLAGYQANTVDDTTEIYIDAHNRPVHPPVWELYETALTLFGDKPTLIEWDNDLPPLQVLLDEAIKADHLRASHQRIRTSHVA